MTDQPPAGGAYPPPPEPPVGSGSPPPPPPLLPDGASYPPPPPSSGGYVPPPPGPAIRALPVGSYTPWLIRVLAALIDWVPYLVVVGIGRVIMLATAQVACTTDVTAGAPGQQYEVNQYWHCVSHPSMLGQLAQWLLGLVGLVYLVWNYGYRQGTTGSSVGKSILKFKVVSEVTGEPLGFGMSIVRQLAHLVDAFICYVGFLWPLWDAKRQTLADKIMTTVCLPL